MAKNELREKQTALRETVKTALKEIVGDRLLEIEENSAVFLDTDVASVEIKIVLKKERLEVDQD